MGSRQNSYPRFLSFLPTRTTSHAWFLGRNTSLSILYLPRLSVLERCSLLSTGTVVSCHLCSFRSHRSSSASRIALIEPKHTSNVATEMLKTEEEDADFWRVWAPVKARYLQWQTLLIDAEDQEISEAAVLDCLPVELPQLIEARLHVETDLHEQSLISAPRLQS